jgi:hypothetical protein
MMAKQGGIGYGNWSSLCLWAGSGIGRHGVFLHTPEAKLRNLAFFIIAPPNFSVMISLLAAHAMLWNATRGNA